ncbi:MAG: hypothetical protein J7J36_06570 [Thermoplasmata archaeon]|nr:hypothetical protein [Thermoplasmata archaeon]
MNKNGFFLPIKLFISIAIIAIIITLTFSFWKVAEKNLAEKELEKEIDKVIANVETMSGYYRDVYNYLDENGSKREIEITLPSSIEYVSFGGNADGNIVSDGKCIFYKINGKSMHVKWLENIKFRKGIKNGIWIPSEEPFVIKKAGNYRLIFENVRQGNDKFVIIYSQT